MSKLQGWARHGAQRGSCKATEPESIVMRAHLTKHKTWESFMEVRPSYCDVHRLNRMLTADPTITLKFSRPFSNEVANVKDSILSSHAK